MYICITKISVLSMAPIKERLNNIVNTRNFTNVVVQIILTLILFSKISNAFWDWNRFWCSGKPLYTLSFDNQLPKDFPTYLFKKRKDFPTYGMKSNPVIVFEGQSNPVIIKCNGPLDNTNRTAHWEDKLGKFNFMWCIIWARTNISLQCLFGHFRRKNYLDENIHSLW